MKPLTEMDTDGVYEAEFGSLKEGFLTQMGHSLRACERDKSLVAPGYKKGVKKVRKLTRCSRRKAHKIFALAYASREACRVLLRRNSFLDPQELFDVACEVLEEELDRLKLSPEQIDSMRSTLEELLERDL